VSGDIGATWRTAQRLLNNDHRVVYDDTECAKRKLVSTFSLCRQGQPDPKQHHRGITDVSSLRVCCATALRARAVSIWASNWQRNSTLAICNAKSSPLDVLPCSLLKGCADVFTPIITRLAKLSFQTGNYPSSYKIAQVLPISGVCGGGGALGA